jgi:hypothetical protein
LANSPYDRQAPATNFLYYSFIREIVKEKDDHDLYHRSMSVVVAFALDLLVIAFVHRGRLHYYENSHTIFIIRFAMPVSLVL